MVPTTLVAFVAILSSFTGANGAVIQRDTTYLSPQPTAVSPTSSLAPSVAPTQPTTAVGTGTSSQVTGTAGSTSATGGGTTSPLPTQSGTPSSIPSGVSSGTSSSVLSGITSGVPPATPSANSSSTSSGVPSAIPSGTTTPTPTGTTDCDGVQQWQASFAYTVGDQVIYYDQLFTARQWTYDNTPLTHPDQWSPEGTCTQPINNTANCNGVSAWQSTVAYTTGNQVTYNGHLWSAVQWTESNSPGDASGTWKDQGACA